VPRTIACSSQSRERVRFRLLWDGPPGRHEEPDLGRGGANLAEIHADPRRIGAGMRPRPPRPGRRRLHPAHPDPPRQAPPRSSRAPVSHGLAVPPAAPIRAASGPERCGERAHLARRRPFGSSGSPAPQTTRTGAQLCPIERRIPGPVEDERAHVRVQDPSDINGSGAERACPRCPCRNLVGHCPCLSEAAGRLTRAEACR
jgi:hypothetical protein